MQPGGVIVKILSSPDGTDDSPSEQTPGRNLPPGATLLTAAGHFGRRKVCVGSEGGLDGTFHRDRDGSREAAERGLGGKRPGCLWVTLQCLSNVGLGPSDRPPVSWDFAKR